MSRAAAQAAALPEVCCKPQPQPQPRPWGRLHLRENRLHSPRLAPRSPAMARGSAERPQANTASARPPMMVGGHSRRDWHRQAGAPVVDYLWWGLVWCGLLSSPANAGLLTAAPAPTSDIAMKTVAAIFLPKLLSMIFLHVLGHLDGVIEIGEHSFMAMLSAVYPPMVLVPWYRA